jgi:FtsZ-interacting cell division protein ZipA
MSELQIGLLSIGFLLVVAVYLYGFWQQRSYRRKFGSPSKSPLENASHQSKSKFKAAAADALLDEEVYALENPEPQRSSNADEINHLLNPETDYIVIIKLKVPLSSEVLAPLWEQRFDFGKNVNAYGLNAPTSRWERLIPESVHAYSEFKIGLQLANRSGPVSEIRLMNFHEVLRNVSEQINVEVEMPSVVNSLKQAKLLDEFCAEVDQMIGLNILPGGDRLLFGSEIARVAESRGLQLQSDGDFHLLNENGRTVFSLGNVDKTPFQHHTLTQVRVSGLTLLLDVPRVEHPVSRFDEMAVLARELANDLRAGLVDDHRVTLGEEAIAQIQEQVAAIESRMLAGKITPGSVQALRLFA